MSRSPAHWTLSCLPSSLLSFSFIFLEFILGYLACIHHTHTHTIPKNYLSPAAWRPKKFYIRGRQVAGESSDLLGCVYVCAVCVCVGWLSLFTSSVSLHSLFIHCLHQFSYNYSFSFPVGAALLKKVRDLSIYPFFSNPVVTDNFLFLLLCLSTCGLTGLLGTLQLQRLSFYFYFIFHFLVFLMFFFIV